MFLYKAFNVSMRVTANFFNTGFFYNFSRVLNQISSVKHLFHAGKMTIISPNNVGINYMYIIISEAYLIIVLFHNVCILKKGSKHTW